MTVIHSRTAAAAATLSSAPIALNGDTVTALISVALGLSGVALARTVFINRMRRSTGMRESIGETLPLTLSAMLIVGVVIWERKTGMSMSVFIGLGVGWSAILLLDVIGAWVLKTGRRVAGVTDKEMGIPEDMSRKLDELREPKDRQNEEIRDPVERQNRDER